MFNLFSKNKRTLTVEVIEAQNLLAIEKNGTSEPIVQMHLFQ